MANKNGAPAQNLWKKGQSGNPAGPRKGAEKRAQEAIALRTYVAADGVTYEGKDIAMQVLVDIATSKTEKARDRSTAALALLDRTFGRPVPLLDNGDTMVVGAYKLPRALTDEELEVLARLDDGLSDGDATT